MSLHWSVSFTILLTAPPLAAQTGGFIATLGVDTVQLERFARTGDTVSGTVVTRVPQTRVLKWRMIFGRSGRPLHYESTLTDATGGAIATDGATAVLDYLGDSIVKQIATKAGTVTQRVSAPLGGWPTPSIPYVGVSYLMYEFAIADLRARGAGPDAKIYQLYTLSAVPGPQPKQAWLPTADSAELDYFGVARSGYRFDGAGRLLRADWSRTTYRYHIARIGDIDVDASAARWHAADLAGRGLGTLSPRDTARGAVGSSLVTVDYSRPSRRGRTLWGEVVKNDSVWRLGADMATHFTTSADLTIGGTRIPAGRYTLWMLYTSDGRGSLVVNSRVNIFGTAYDPRSDFARIPMVRTDGEPNVERLTIGAGPSAITIAWGTVRWSVAVTSP